MVFNTTITTTTNNNNISLILSQRGQKILFQWNRDKGYKKLRGWGDNRDSERHEGQYENVVKNTRNKNSCYRIISKAVWKRKFLNEKT